MGRRRPSQAAGVNVSTLTFRLPLPTRMTFALDPATSVTAVTTRRTSVAIAPRETTCDASRETDGPGGRVCTDF